MTRSYDSTLHTVETGRPPNRSDIILYTIRLQRRAADDIIVFNC